MSDSLSVDAISTNPQPQQSPDRYRTYFLTSGLVFIIASLALFLLTGWIAYTLGHAVPEIGIPESGGPNNSGQLSQREAFNFFGRILSFFFAPLLTIFSACICAIVGSRLLKSSGAIATYVISPQDYQVLGPAVAAGNDAAITQFIRLSALTGVTGTFTKIGLTGLPLATIFLTLLLAAAGLANVQFFELAKLTLGAFLGSFVQRQAEDPTRRAPTSKV